MIGNRSKDEFKLSCCRCGTTKDLSLVAHRNKFDLIVGYLFTCLDCLLIIGGKYTVELKEIEPRTLADKVVEQ